MTDGGRPHDAGGSYAMLTKKPPLYTAGGTAYPFSQALLDLATVETRYGEEYSLAHHHEADGTLWLPRGACPLAEDDRRCDGEVVPYGNHFKPRKEEQQSITDEAVLLLSRGESFIVQAPTGWGKTFVGCAIAARVRRKTLVITTKEDIIEQWVKAAREVLGLDPADIDIWRGDDTPAPDAKFVVSLVQSVMKGPARYPDVDFSSFGFVVSDEVHRMGADQFSQAMWWFPAKLRMGLSATPYRKDGREYVFMSHIGPVALTATQETLVPRVVIRRSEWTVPRVSRKDPDGQWRMKMLPHEAGKLGHITKMLGKSLPRNLMIVRFIKRAYERKRNLIVFSDSLAHLHTLHSLLLTDGIPEEAIGFYVGLTGSTYKGSKKERKAERERSKVKSVILATYQMASEATDIPWLDACVLAIPRADVVQIVGRIRREYPDKPTPVVLDIVDADSPVFASFAKKRMYWYQSLGCEIRS